MKIFISALLVCVMAAPCQAQAHAQAQDRTTFRVVHHRTDRYPQPSDLMPPRFLETVSPNSPVPISPTEPFTHTDSTGPMKIERKNLAAEVDEILAERLGKDFVGLCKQTPNIRACRQYLDIVENCPKRNMDSVTCMKAIQSGP